MNISRCSVLQKEGGAGGGLLSGARLPGEREALRLGWCRCGHPVQELWEAVVGAGPRSSADSCMCVTVFAEGNLYAVGGYDSSSHLATVEKYEPQVNMRESIPGNPFACPLLMGASKGPAES